MKSQKLASQKIVRGALDKVIDIAGSQSAVGSKCKVDQKTVSAWYCKGQIPSKHIPILYFIAGGQIPAEEFLGINKTTLPKN